MTIDLDKPTRTRRTKSLEEQVAEADAIPWEGAAITALHMSPDEAADAIAALEDEEDTGEIAMTSEQQAEFEARARLGFGGPNGTVIVTGYDDDGDA